MLCGGKLFWKNVELVPKVFMPARHCSAANQQELAVKIPERVKRKPTDILKALASTVEVDPTAFHYKYPDDPFFYAYSTYDKRIYALSMESGRKSARWVVENNPGFFKNQLSQPPIQSFLQKQVFDDKSEVTEETLVGVIERREVENAITVYNLLLQNGIIVSDNVKQNLLELVCFYNAKNKPFEEELESKWFSNVEQSNFDVNMWTEESFAETLFESMDQNCPLANSAIIQGMIKFNNVQKALEIYKKAKSNNVKFSVGVYNALLSQASNNNIDIGDGFDFIDVLLREMLKESIRPNVGTLNATLKSLMHLQHVRRSENHAKKVLMEFVHLGVQPSLASYYYLMRILGFSKKGMLHHRNEFMGLLDIIHSTKMEAMDPADFLFFPNMMKMFTYDMKDVELADRLHQILFSNDNIKFIQNSFSESMYFREYISFAFKAEPLEIAMKKYREVVPTLYSPETLILSIALKTIIANGATEYLIEVWEDIKSFRATRVLRLTSIILALVKDHREEAVLNIVHEGAVQMMQYFEENELQWARQDNVSQMLLSFLIMKDYDRALKLFRLVQECERKDSLIDAEALLEFFNFVLSERKLPLVLECLKYAEKEGYSEMSKMAEMALPMLSESDRSWVAGLIRAEEEGDEESEGSDGMGRPSPTEVERESKSFEGKASESGDGPTGAT